MCKRDGFVQVFRDMGRTEFYIKICSLRIIQLYNIFVAFYRIEIGFVFCILYIIKNAQDIRANNDET